MYLPSPNMYLPSPAVYLFLYRVPTTYLVLPFGPFLLQNLSLMLVYWLLHVYNVAFLGALMLKTIKETPDGQTIFMQGLALAGSALVIG